MSKSCEEKLKDTYYIQRDKNLLKFKIDIKRNDTITKQVEYKIYNPDPRKIHENLDLSNCISDEKRQLEENKNELNINEIIVLSPVNWNDIQLQFIDELYIKNKINLFNPNEKFYNDVCFKYKTPNNSDIYIESRRKKYFINEPVCESDCTFIEYVIETNKVKCKCPLKSRPIAPENITFSKVYNDYPFNNTVNAPNILVLKCLSNISFSWGVALSIICIILFILSYMFRTKVHKNEFKEELKKLIDELMKIIKNY